MRSAEEVREAQIDRLRRYIEHPQGWAADGRAVQTLIQVALQDLCFIDECESTYTKVCEGLYRYGKLGVSGAFDAVFGTECKYVPETASVFAQLAMELGYIEPSRRLSEFEWRSFMSGLRSRFEEVDVRRSEIIEALGEPGLVVGGDVLCYVGPSSEDWVAFDCWEAPITRYFVEERYIRGNFRVERAEDPLLRDIRAPAPSFNESLIMTTYGKVLRWGPGWWLHKEPTRQADAPEGAREQLQDINAGDPSQSLGPRRP